MKHVLNKDPISSAKELARKKEYYQENREWILEKKKKYYHDNKERILEVVYKRRSRVRKMLFERLGGVCSHPDCNKTEHLEFDHIKPEDKKFDISTSLDRKEEDLIAEVDKCQLFCQKHHLEKTKNDWLSGALYPNCKNDRNDGIIEKKTPLEMLFNYD